MVIMHAKHVDREILASSWNFLQAELLSSRYARYLEILIRELIIREREFPTRFLWHIKISKFPGLEN